VKNGLIATIVVFTALLLPFQNCAQKLPPEVLTATDASSIQQPGESTTTTMSPLSVTPAIQTIDFSQPLQLSPSGGVPPYTFTIVSGSGTISAGGLFTPPQAAEANVIEVKDSAGNTINSTITSIGPLKLATNPASPTVSDATTLIPSGGVGPYVVQFLSGPGSFNGTVYTPGSTTGNILFKVTDSREKSEQFSITISATPKVAVNRYERIYYSYDSEGNQYPVTEVRYSTKTFAVSGFNFTGVAFYLFANAGTSGRTAVTHCTAGSGYYIYHSKAACPGGYVNGGVVGYVSNAQVPNSSLLYVLNYAYEQQFSPLAGSGYTSFGYVAH